MGKSKVSLLRIQAVRQVVNFLLIIRPVAKSVLASILILLAMISIAHAQTNNLDSAQRAAALLPVISLLLLDDDRLPQLPLTLDQQSANIFIGEMFTNTISGGSGGGILRFSTSNRAIASVDRDTGQVTGVTAGVAIITVFRRGDVEFSNSSRITFTVTVAQQAQAGLLAADDNLQVDIGASANNEITGGDGTGALLFTSSDPSIASVDSLTGVVTGVAASDENIFITVNKAGDDMFLPATPINFTVTVNKLSQADVTFASAALSIEMGLIAVPQLAQGGSGTGAFNYSSSNQSIATVNATTGEVTGISVGQATIMVLRSSDAQFLDSDLANYTITVIGNGCIWDNDTWGNCNWQ